MDNFDNIFSMTNDSNHGIGISNQINDNWLLGSLNSIPIPTQQQLQQILQPQQQQQQQQFANDIINYQTTHINNTIITQQQQTPIIQPIVADSNNNSPIDFNQQIKDQISLLQQQQAQQQIHLQQQIINFQIQQQQNQIVQQHPYQRQYLQEPISQILSNINNNSTFSPVSDQHILNSMKTTETTNTKPTTSNKSIKENKDKDTEDKEDTSPTITTTGKKKKCENKFYHKKHREKKKDYVKEIEDKIAALTFENQQMVQENQRLREHGEGVENLLPDSDALKLYSETMKITIKMKEALDNDDERTLVYLLEQYHSTFPHIISICSEEVEKMFHPNFQQLLTIFSYRPYCDPEIYDVITGPGSDSWINQFKIESGLTEEQFLKFNNLRLLNRKLEEQLLEERLALDLELKSLINKNLIFLPKNPLELHQDDLPYPIDISKTSISNSPTMDIGQSLEFICKLNTLKNKVFLGRIQLMDLYSSIGSIFSPKQESMFLVRIGLLISFKLSHFTMLNHVWRVLMPSKSVFNIAESLEQMVNNKTGEFDIGYDKSTFSLKPASFTPNLNK